VAETQHGGLTFDRRRFASLGPATEDVGSPLTPQTLALATPGGGLVHDAGAAYGANQADPAGAARGSDAGGVPTPRRPSAIRVDLFRLAVRADDMADGLDQIAYPPLVEDADRPEARSRSTSSKGVIVLAWATQSFVRPNSPDRNATQFGWRDRTSNLADVIITATTQAPRFSSSRETTTTG
jgi:hypothetical protein